MAITVPQHLDAFSDSATGCPASCWQVGTMVPSDALTLIRRIPATSLRTVLTPANQLLLFSPLCFSALSRGIAEKEAALRSHWEAAPGNGGASRAQHCTLRH